LINCTIASFGNLYIAHKNPVLQVTDYDASTGVTGINPLIAVFQNCIFWGDYGNVDDEITTYIKGISTSVKFDHCLYKANMIPQIVLLLQ